MSTRRGNMEVQPSRISLPNMVSDLIRLFTCKTSLTLVDRSESHSPLQTFISNNLLNIIESLSLVHNSRPLVQKSSLTLVTSKQEQSLPMGSGTKSAEIV